MMVFVPLLIGSKILKIDIMCNRISIITPNYNSGDLLHQCTDSIYAQLGIGKKYDLEHIIVDGYSSDQSLNFLDHTYKYTKIIHQKPNGVYSAMNCGLSDATGEIIAFLHADDMFADRTVLNSVNYLMQQGKISLVYGNLMIVNRLKTEKIERTWISGSFAVEKLNNGWMPPHPTVFVKRHVYDNVGFFDETFRISGDYDWIIKAFVLYKDEISYLEKDLVIMRSGGVSNSGQLGAFFNKTLEDLIVIRKNNIGGFRTLILKKIRKLNQLIWMRKRND